MMIEYKNISKKYDRQEILKDVSFAVKKGDIFVLVGPSGSGKTTLLKMFNRLIEPTKGQILLNDKPIKEYNLRKLREKTGYVLQTASLFPNLTVGENITIVLEQEGVDRKERRKKQEELLKSVDLDPKLYCDRMPSELSGGEQQRVGIVRALAADPEVVLMDEPFSALDPVVRKQLQDLLINLHEQFNKTVMFVTHDMQEAIRLGNTIGVLHRHPATKFIQEFFAGNRINQKLDLEILLKSELGVDPRFYPKVDTLVRYHVDSIEDLIKDCSNHPDTLFIAETRFGEFLIEPKRVWNLFLKWVAGHD